MKPMLDNETGARIPGASFAAQDDGVVQHYLATAEDEYYEGESADGIEEA